MNLFVLANEERKGIADATVYSVRPLSDEEKHSIEKHLQEKQEKIIRVRKCCG